MVGKQFIINVVLDWHTSAAQLCGRGHNGVYIINGCIVIVLLFAWYSYVHRDLETHGLVLILGYVVHMGLRFPMVPLV